MGQEFTKDYYMWSRPSAYHYNVYVEDEEGNQYYNDGSEFAGLASGSNNYAPSNPALAERVEADIEAFLAKNPDVNGVRSGGICRERDCGEKYGRQDAGYFRGRDCECAWR